MHDEAVTNTEPSTSSTGQKQPDVEMHDEAVTNAEPSTSSTGHDKQPDVEMHDNGVTNAGDSTSSTGQTLDDIFVKMQNISKVVQGKVRENIKRGQARQKLNYDRQHVSQVGEKMSLNERKFDKKINFALNYFFFFLI